MIEQYSHSIGGGGFQTNCTLNLNKSDRTFEITFDELNMSVKNNVKIKGTFEYEKNNYYVLNTTQLILNNTRYKSDGITFEFIKFDTTHEVTECNNEWKDIAMGNRVKFNNNYDFDAMLVIQREIFDYRMVSSQHSELEKVLCWFSNMKFLQIIVADDSIQDDMFY